MAVIELADSELRVAILDRQSDDPRDQIRLLTVPWRNESQSPNTQQGREELIDALRAVVDQYNLAGCKVRIVLAGRYCVTKAILGSTDEVKSELQQLHQRSQLYLLLGAGEKVAVSHSKSLDARHTYAVAAVCNVQTLNTLVAASEATGLKIESIEPALVANSRAAARLHEASENPALLIHMDQSGVEIGITHKGRLLLEYRPGSCQTPEEIAEVVRTHFGRLERHVSRVLGESQECLRDIYLSGNKSDTEKALRALSKLKNLQPRVIRPAEIKATWQINAETDDPATVPVLGALLGTYLPVGESDAPNFMQHVTAMTREPLKPILVRSLLPVAAVLLVALSLKLINLHQQSGINALQMQVDELAVAQTRSRELELRRSASESKLAQLDKLASCLPSYSPAVALRRIAQCMPNDVWLNSLTLTNGQAVSLKGSSFLEAGIFDFVRWLELAPGMKKVALRGTKSGQSQSGPTVDFDVELVVSERPTEAKKVARHE